MQARERDGERGPGVDARRRRLVALVAGLAGLAVVLAPTAGPAGAGPAEDTSFVRAVHVDLLGREPTGDELSSYVDGIGDGDLTRGAVARQVSYGLDNLTQEVDELFAEALDRAPDPQGQAFFVNTMGYTSYSLAQANADVYGSQEYVNRHAAAPGPWVEGIFADLLGRAPDAGALTYWSTVASTKGPRFAALRIYQSDEHRRNRVGEVFQEMLGRAPEPAALGYWADRLTVQLGDLWLAIKLASTPEYDARATARFP